MSHHTPRALKGILGTLACGFLLIGCEQPPSETDPPPTTPGERRPDTDPPRQPLGERRGAVSDHGAVVESLASADVVARG